MSQPAFVNLTAMSGRPTIELAYDAKPSWKNYGSGRAWVRLTLNPHGSLSIDASEIPEGDRGAKRVMVDLPPEAVALLLSELLKAAPDRTARALAILDAEAANESNQYDRDQMQSALQSVHAAGFVDRHAVGNSARVPRNPIQPR